MTRTQRVVRGSSELRELCLQRVSALYILIDSYGYTHLMKHLVDIDDELLEQAKTCLRTPTIKATVDEALRRATTRKADEQREALRGLGQIFAKIPDFDRSEAW